MTSPDLSISTASRQIAPKIGYEGYRKIRLNGTNALDKIFSLILIFKSMLNPTIHSRQICP